MCWWDINVIGMKKRKQQQNLEQIQDKPGPALTLSFIIKEGLNLKRREGKGNVIESSFIIR